MSSSNSKENAEKFSGDELDDLSKLVDEESESIPEEEDPKSAEQFSGLELDELDIASIPEEEDSKSAERFSGDELDESEDEESESVQVSGDELDESEDEESESVPEKEDSKSTERKYGGKKRLSLVVAIGLCLLTGIGYFYLKEKKYPISVNQQEVNQKLNFAINQKEDNHKEKTIQINRLGIPKDQLLIFQPFVIPFSENKEFTYFSLSISFNVPNKEIKREIIEKRNQLRGIIYDILREEMNKIKDIPPLDKLKSLIIRGINMTLSAGKVNEVYITKFLAV